jgi:hypothetical protein
MEFCSPIPRNVTYHFVTVKIAGRAQNMEMRMPSREVVKRMDGDSDPGNCIFSGKASRKNSIKVARPQRLSTDRRLLSQIKYPSRILGMLKTKNDGGVQA